MAAGIQKIGILGGLNWVSTAEYYRRLNALVQARLGGVASARLVVESVNRQDYVDAVIERRDESAAREYVHQRIYDELVVNRFDDTTRAGYREVIARLAAAGAEGVILGCTEIPPLLGAEDVGIPTLATTELHCITAVEHALQARQPGRRRPPPGGREAR